VRRREKLPPPFIEMRRHRRAARLPRLFGDHPGK
jgi:hypothetical protein